MQRPYLRKEVGMFALLFQTTIGWLDVLLDSLVFGLAVGYVLYKSRASLASRLFKRGVKEFRGFRRCFERSQLFSMLVNPAVFCRHSPHQTIRAEF